MVEVFGYVASFCVGLILGLIGGGGSILSIPILVYLFTVEVIEATAYSLFIVGTTSLVGSIQKYKHSLVDFRVGLIFGLPSILSKFTTRKWIVPSIPDVLLQTESFVLTKRLFMLGIFSIMVIIAATSMIRNNNKPHTYHGKAKDVWLGVQGIFIGFLTGIAGLGGGFIIVPTLLFFAKIPFKKAVGTALFIIALNSLTGFLGDLSNLDVAWPFLLTITGIAITGIFIGNIYSQRVSGLQLKKSFGWFILVMGIAILIRESLVLL